MAINFNYNYPQVAREAGFKLRQFKDGPIDWRIVGSIETERLLQDQRLEQLDTLLAHLSEAPLATMLDTNILDSGIVKYFVVSQFAIQYLLFCRKFLDETIHELREAHATSQMDVAKLRKSLTESNNEILQLHKKITQIEAIHEVVYPCHLCTKSFISNEALNIHISRRHATRISSSTMNMGGAGVGSTSSVVGAPDRRTDTPAGASIKEREHNDLQLINAIKLELEIKQLKERLNNAERDIRERRTATLGSRHHTPRDSQQRTLKNIAVQSELQETKEQDDIVDGAETNPGTGSSEMRERKAQLNSLQAKVQEFETWRETQQANNQKSIAEINRKLNEIVHTLEEAKALPSVPLSVTSTLSTVEPSTDQKLDNNDVNEVNASHRRGSPSVEDLERLLTEKVVEIGQKSAEKLEEFVHNMEANYKEKLEDLEREIRKRDAAEHERLNEMKLKTEKTSTPNATASDVNVLPRVITYTAFNPTESDSSLNARPEPEPAKRMPRLNRSISAEPESLATEKAKNNDETYILNDNKASNEMVTVKPKPRVRQIKSMASTKSADKAYLQGSELYSQSTESNRTFVKNEKCFGIQENENGIRLDDANTNDSTDISGTLSSASDSDGKCSSTYGSTRLTYQHGKLKHKIKQEEAKKSRSQIKPKLITRNNVQRMVNKRLILSGLDPKENSLSAAAMKHLSAELSDQRHALKQKYPNFYPTRNKIKKLVDKLCSTKLPAPIEDMLKHTKPIQPKRALDKPPKPDTAQHSSEEDRFGAADGTSTPIQMPQSLRESDGFKQRLERILASPIRRPRNDDDKEQLAMLQLHSGTKSGPVPLTRKRVMFNTLSPDGTANGSTSDVPIN